MIRNIYLNVAVKNLEKSKTFFTALGFTLNPQMSSDAGACVVLSDHISVMLLTYDTFNTFSPNPPCDTSKATEVLMTFTCESRAEVDSIIAKAIAAGGRAHGEAQDHNGQMYDHGFVDLDGHSWGVIWINPAAAQKA